MLLQPVVDSSCLLETSAAETPRMRTSISWWRSRESTVSIDCIKVHRLCSHQQSQVVRCTVEVATGTCAPRGIAGRP